MNFYRKYTLVCLLQKLKITSNRLEAETTLFFNSVHGNAIKIKRLLRYLEDWK